jgi:hypothetical protein
MDIALNLLATIGAVGVAGVAGYLIGVRLRTRRPWLYWAANVVVVLLGAAVIAAGTLMGSDAAWLAGLGVIAGGLTGLKYGLGRVVAQWRAQAGTPDGVRPPDPRDNPSIRPD